MLDIVALKDRNESISLIKTNKPPPNHLAITITEQKPIPGVLIPGSCWLLKLQIMVVGLNCIRGLSLLESFGFYCYLYKSSHITFIVPWSHLKWNTVGYSIGFIIFSIQWRFACPSWRPSVPLYFHWSWLQNIICQGSFQTLNYLISVFVNAMIAVLY